MESNSLNVICTLDLAVNELKPLLGKRRCNGICPPSKPTLWYPPARLFCPLCPRPQVLPNPLPIPRPTRRFAWLLETP